MPTKWWWRIQVDIELCGKLRKELGRDNNPRIPMCVFHGGRKQFKFNHKTSFFAKYYIWSCRDVWTNVQNLSSLYQTSKKSILPKFERSFPLIGPYVRCLFAQPFVFVEHFDAYFDRTVDNAIHGNNNVSWPLVINYNSCVSLINW